MMDGRAGDAIVVDCGANESAVIALGLRDGGERVPGEAAFGLFCVKT